ncbi:hypothetical protein EZS27_035398 [termite gut metagenome]|uniref:GIY-YIG domain-containing protein n=1 Tax=termite gut metagenome TaxID=433724 RepID=A0A5J4PYK6_9ZZZZ
MERVGFIYIMTNKNKTTLYIGVTNNLQRRVLEHKNHFIKNSIKKMEQNKKRLADYKYKSGMGRSMGQNTKNGILNFS